MLQMPTLVDMLKAGVHFGHQSSRWHPKMQPYIFGTRNGIHVINLEKTEEELATSLDYVRGLAREGKIVLFVGTKRQARSIIREAAESCGMPYLVERWIGGLLTNFDECKRRLKKYMTLTDQIKTGEIEKYTKKEQVAIKKQVEKMDKYLKGLVGLDRLPDALYIADLRIEKTAITEARKMNIPTVAVCDTNVDPTKATYVIPANDDAVNSIRMIAQLIAAAANEGTEEFKKNKITSIEEKNAPKKEKRALTKEQSV
jgi:small subunit ribosomal protein S2